MIVSDFTRNDFKKSGISDLTLNEYIQNGYLTSTPDFWKLKYPAMHENKPTEYYNLRYKNPVGSKYIKPKDVCSRLFRPLALSPNIISNRNEYVIITEGEKKAIKAVQEGFNCIALAGVWAWKQKPKENDDNKDTDDIDTDNSSSDIIPDISSFDFTNKVIYLCYDNDMWIKPQVKQALYRFSAYLIAEKKAIVRIIKLPECTEKLGLDDYLIKYENEEFKKLLDNAESIDLKKIQHTLSGKSDLKINFPVEIFPENIKNLAINLHKRLDAPLEYICCTFLLTVSMLMDYRFKVNANPSSNWIEYPILWCALVGKPSQKKTPCLKIGKKILDKFEAQLQTIYQEKLDEYNDKLFKYKIELKEYKKNIEDKKNNITIAKLPKEPTKPPKPHLTIQNATVEALYTAIDSNKEYVYGVGLFIDELSHLLNGFNQYKKGGGNDKEYFLQAWCRDTQTFVRKGSNEDITIEASHNIIGGIQPKVLDNTLFLKGIDSTEGMIERWLYCCTDYEETGDLPEYDNNYEVSAIQNCCEKIFGYKNTPKEYKFDKNAHNHFKYLCKTITESVKSDNKTDLEKSYLLKQKSYIARIALILHCIENLDKPEISKDTLNNAFKVSNYFICCFENLITDRITSNKIEDYALNLLRLKGLKEITPSALEKLNTSRFKKGEGKAILENLASKGYGRVCKSGTRGHKFIFYG